MLCARLARGMLSCESSMTKNFLKDLLVNVSTSLIHTFCRNL